MLILKRLTQRFHLSTRGNDRFPSHCPIELETFTRRSQPIHAETLSELLEGVSDSDSEEQLYAEGLEDILRYIGNG